MNFPIIDVSKQSVAQFAVESSKAQAVRSVAWYRVVRPALVLCMWVLAVVYIRWCLENASPEELSLDAFMPVIAGIAAVALTMILWTFARQMDAMSSNRTRRMPLREEVRHDETREITFGNAGRCLVAYHDDDGVISHVVSMPEFERQAA